MEEHLKNTCHKVTSTLIAIYLVEGDHLQLEEEVGQGLLLRVVEEEEEELQLVLLVEEEEGEEEET